MYPSNMSLTDPPMESSLAHSVIWIQDAALGTVATTVAVIAVAAIGLLMLSGRLELRRGITVVLGCFILFGSAGIAAALTGMSGAGAQPYSTVAPNPGQLSSQLRIPTPAPTVYDPYAGASVPVNR